jgi:hypothetical protein
VRFAKGMVAMGLIGGLFGMLAGCGGGAPEPAAAKQSLDDSRTSIQDAARKAADVAEGAGFSVPSVSGQWLGCGMESTSGLEYHADGLLGGGDGDLAQRVERLASALAKSSWTRRAATTDQPFAQLEDDKLLLTIQESRVHPGSLALGISGPCVRATSDQEAELARKPEKFIG